MSTERPVEIRNCVVCVNVTCVMDGSRQILEALRARLEDSQVTVREEVCLGACGQGPNVLLHPRGTWLSPVRLDDVEDIVAHIHGGPAPDRLLGHIPPDLHEMILSILDSLLDPPS